MVRIAPHSRSTRGAHGITVHPRPDAPPYPRRAMSPSLLKLARAAAWNSTSKAIRFSRCWSWCAPSRPDQCTLVPDDPGASTSDHGWDLDRDGDRLEPVIAELKALGVRVSLFMDADEHARWQRRASTRRRPRRALYRTLCARVRHGAARRQCWPAIRAAAQAAQHGGLGVNAGHDLNRENLPLFLRSPSPTCWRFPSVMRWSRTRWNSAWRKRVRLYLDAIRTRAAAHDLRHRRGYRGRRAASSACWSEYGDRLPGRSWHPRSAPHTRPAAGRTGSSRTVLRPRKHSRRRWARDCVTR